MRSPTACVAAVVAAVGVALSARAVSASEGEPFALSSEAASALQACMAENDDARRLTCYDNALNRPAGHQTRTSPKPTPEAAPATTPEQRFGMSAAQVVKKEHLAESPKQVTSQVAELAHVQGGNLKVTLANGQIWVQQNADGAELSIRVGDSVTVSHEMAGGFLLTSPASGHRSMRVRRIH